MSFGTLRTVPPTHRTLIMEISVRDDDSSLTGGNLPRLYGHCLSSKTMQTSLWSSTVHNSHEFSLSDEFKVQLPLHIGEKLHIFITLYACCRKVDTSSEEMQKMHKVGYAVFPVSNNGVLRVKDEWNIKFLSADQVSEGSGMGYLSYFAEAPEEAYLNGGMPVLCAGTQTRTSVHASNAVIAGLLKDMPSSLERIVRDDQLFLVSGNLKDLYRSDDDALHSGLIRRMRKLPLAEVLAFYPLLSFFVMSMISSPSKSVSLPCRTAAMEVLLDISLKTQQYDLTARSRQSHYSARGVHKTSVTRFLYHHLTNDVLQNRQRQRLYAGFAETWLHLLLACKSYPNTGTQNTVDSGARQNLENDRRNIRKHMADLSWFLFGVILRSIYIWALENPHVPRSKLFDPSFYSVVADLCVEVLEVLDGFGIDDVLVRRTALFIRNLFNFCDRGKVLSICERVVEFFEKREDMEGLGTFMNILLDDADVVTLMIPSSSYTRPVFLTRIVVRAFSLLLSNPSHVVRSSSADVLYKFICRVANSPRYPAKCLRWLASQLLALVREMSLQWKAYVQLCEKTESAATVDDKRQLCVSMLWIVYYAPPNLLRSWMEEESNHDVISGLVTLMVDAQQLFRYAAGTNKVNPHGVKTPTQWMRDWDARMSTFVCAIGAYVGSCVHRSLPLALRTICTENVDPVVYPFFHLLEGILHLGNSTAALQIGSCALLEVVRSIFSELMSSASRMCSGITVLVMSLMGSCSIHVRSIAEHAFLLMCYSCHTWRNSIAQMRPPAFSAVMFVAESKKRNIRLAGVFLDQHLERAVQKAHKMGDSVLPLTESYIKRYKSGIEHPSGDVGTRRWHGVEEPFTSVDCRNPIALHAVSEGGAKMIRTAVVDAKDGRGVGKEANARHKLPSLAEELTSLREMSVVLFNRAQFLTQSEWVGLKEMKCRLHFQLALQLLRVGAVHECLKWLQHLHELHKANNNKAEAGMVLLFVASLSFRLTQAFYQVKGKEARGARIPFVVFSYVYWHDYVRLLPEVDALLSSDVLYDIVLELRVLPSDPCLTVSGHLDVLRGAASLLEKERYTIFSVGILSIVERYYRLLNDFKAAASIHIAMEDSCFVISKEDAQKRENFRYFLLWARMKGAPAEVFEQKGTGDTNTAGALPLKCVIKLPAGTEVKDIVEPSKEYIGSVVGDAVPVVVGDALVEKEEEQGKERSAPENCCLLSVCPVVPCFPTGRRKLVEGYDGNVALNKFEYVTYTRKKHETTGTLLQNCLVVQTYHLGYSFPSTTSTIDVVRTDVEILDAAATAAYVLDKSIAILQGPIHNDKLVEALLRALTPVEWSPRPGAYIKEVMTSMGSDESVMNRVKSLSGLLKAKLILCETHDAPLHNTEDYALVLKAVMDIECTLIALNDETGGTSCAPRRE